MDQVGGRREAVSAFRTLEMRLLLMVDVAATDATVLADRNSLLGDRVTAARVAAAIMILVRCQLPLPSASSFRPFRTPMINFRVFVALLLFRIFFRPPPAVEFPAGFTSRSCRQILVFFFFFLSGQTGPRFRQIRRHSRVHRRVALFARLDRLFRFGFRFHRTRLYLKLIGKTRKNLKIGAR